MIILDHHALVFETNFLNAKEDFLRTLGSSLQNNLSNNPDIFIREFARFGIDDAHEIRNLNNSSPVVEEKKHIVVSFEQITLDAQHALLKVIEEPNPQIRFYFFVPSKNILLSTVLSRIMVNPFIKNDEEKPFFEIKKFLALTAKERLALVDTWSTDITKETLTKEAVFTFLKSLRLEVRSLYVGGKDNKTVLLEAIDTALLYGKDIGASYKQLLALVALSV